MKRILLIAVLLLGVVLAAGEKVLIWEVSGPKLPGKAYIAGSIHSGKAKWYPLDQAYDRAFDAASIVYFEIYKPDPQEIARQSLFFSMFQDGRTLSQVLGYADFQTLCAFYATHAPGISPAVLERLRPWFLSVQTGQFYLAKHPEISRTYGLENVFFLHLAGKKPRSLESVESQLRAVSEISDAASARLLMENVRNFDQAGRDLDRIFRALETGVPDELSLIANEMAFKHPEFYRNLFLKRNQAIAEKVHELLKRKQVVFILVGAGHLAGRGNILELLREKGCSTIQLKRIGKPGRIRPQS